MPAEVQNFWLNLGKIQDALLLSDEEFSKYLEIDYTYFLEKKYQLSFLPLNCVFECAEKLNFHFEDLLQDSFNTSAILSRLQGESILLPKYTTATYSSVRPIKNVLSYLAKEKGERSKVNLFRKFQISESFLNNPNQKTNILLITDAIQYLINTYQLKASDLCAIGQMTPHVNTDMQMGLSNRKNVYELVDFFYLEYAQLFDKNYLYRIEKMTSDYVIIESLPNKDAIQELQINIAQFGNENVCFSRMGIMSSIFWPKYKINASIKKLSSLYAGDLSHRYFIDLTPFKNLSSFSRSRLESNAVYH
jgi:hypothetical protein